jgi:DNA-binding beta-propeller fold protein YncE
MLFAAGCVSSPSVTTIAQYNAQVGTTPAPTPDPTGFTAIDINSGNTHGCFPDGGSQPPSPPPGSGWAGLGTSPKPGQCSFSGFSPGTWDFEFFSNQCASAGQPFDFQGFLTTDSSGKVSYTICTIPASAAPSADNHFARSSSLPSTVTVSAAGLTTTSGMPQLLVYDSGLNLDATVNATSVATNGSSATFPFPTNSSGGQLLSGMYMFAVKNLAASGQFKVVDATHFSIGADNTLSSAFGVDAADVVTKSQTCIWNGSRWICGGLSTSTVPTAIVTEYYAGQVTYQGHTLTVGSQPVAVKAYGSSTVKNCICNPNVQTTTWTTGPTSAIVVNSGSNNVSFLNLDNYTTVATIAVGTQPMAIALNSGATMAYVANYGNGTLSEVNLSTRAVTRTATVGAGALSVAMDPSGSYVWVGGSNYLYEVSLSTFTVVATHPVSGSVTSLAVSNAQNEMAYTLVQNCCTNSSTYAANELLLSNLSTPGTYANATASAYAPYTMNGTLPNAAVLPQATYVSAQFGNGVAASSTPTGFVIYDLVNHTQIMSGTTPTPVRGIASDPNNWFVFLTLPDSNEFISVPLPHP